MIFENDEKDGNLLDRIRLRRLFCISIQVFLKSRLELQYRKRVVGHHLIPSQMDATVD